MRNQKRTVKHSMGFESHTFAGMVSIVLLQESQRQNWNGSLTVGLRSLRRELTGI